MKKLATILISGVLLNLAFGCNVYHSGSASVEEAVQTKNRVKVVTTDNVYYEFKRLKNENGKLVGVTGKNSETAKSLRDFEQYKSGNNVKIILPKNEIRGIYLKDKKMSNIVNFGVPLVGAAGIIGITSEGFRPDVGN
ncbi:hypothetical protein [Salinimicrobium gaetbulicola]|uniref:Uncharacterized protein n=1 Tax=Salinimicrobium gaetbulicola TaxID=999702 RepID=A0ABW3IC30_9FLAO